MLIYIKEPNYSRFCMYNILLFYNGENVNPKATSTTICFKIFSLCQIMKFYSEGFHFHYSIHTVNVY